MSLVDSKIFVRRANVILEVPADLRQHYLDLGYNIIDAEGNLIEEAIPTDVGALRIAFCKHVAKIKELEKQLEEAKKSSEETTVKPKRSTKSK